MILLPNFFKSKSDAELYRQPMQVKEYFLHITDGEFPICPRCNISFDIEYRAYCAYCGQCLGWDEYENATQALFKSSFN